MPKRSRYTIIMSWMILIFLMAGCASSSPVVDYNPGFSMKALHTFSVSESQGSNIDPLNSERIHKAITANLLAKGYRSTAPGGEDFIAHYDVYVVQDVPSNFSFGFGVGTYGSHGGGSVGTSVTPTSDNVEIRIDMYDPKSGKIFWSTKVVKTIPDFDSPQSRESFWNSIIYKLLEKFPHAS